MRFAKVFLLILVFFLAMLFFTQNNEVLSQNMTLQLNVFLAKWKSVPLPFYLLLLAAFCAGALFSLAYFILDKLRLVRQIKESNGRVRKLDEEVTSLRNLPLANQSPLAVESPSSQEPSS